MGTRRQVVPAALHSELTEYSSLLRALNTSSTLDVTSHLLPANWKGKGRAVDAEDVDFDSDDDERDLPRTRSASRLDGIRDSSAPLAFPSSPPARSRSRSSAPTKRATPRESWTRWPLLAGDVYVPEWSWDDEVTAIASQLLSKTGQRSASPQSPPTMELLISTPPEPARSSSQATVPTTIEDTSSIGGTHDSSSSTDDPINPFSHGEDDLEGSSASEDDELFPPAYLSALSQNSAAFMSQVLALLAAHTPLRPGSLQNRIGTLTWRNVVDILAVSGFPGIDRSMLRNITAKLEKIYGPHDRAEIAAQRADMQLQASTPASPPPHSTPDAIPHTIPNPLLRSTPSLASRTPTLRDPLADLLYLPPMPPGWRMGGQDGAASTIKLRKRKSQAQLQPRVVKRSRVSVKGKAGEGKEMDAAGREGTGATGRHTAVGKGKGKRGDAKGKGKGKGKQAAAARKAAQNEAGQTENAAQGDPAQASDDDMPETIAPPDTDPHEDNGPLPASPARSPSRHFPSSLPLSQDTFPPLSQILDSRLPSPSLPQTGSSLSRTPATRPSRGSAAQTSRVPSANISCGSRASEDEVQDQLGRVDSNSDSERSDNSIDSTRVDRSRDSERSDSDGDVPLAHDRKVDDEAPLAGRRTRARTKQPGPEGLTKKPPSKRPTKKPVRTTDAAASAPSPVATRRTTRSSASAAAAKEPVASTARGQPSSSQAKPSASQAMSQGKKRKSRIVSAALIEDSGSD
ncbi:hypothetical protein HDZ31DRAFT_35207 [Schizophyllum fasciatum]